MKKKKHVISRVLPGSIGEELELEPGDMTGRDQSPAGGRMSLTIVIS